MISNTLLLSLQIEYETTDITPEHLALKYSLNDRDTEALVAIAAQWSPKTQRGIAQTDIVPVDPTPVEVVPEAKAVINDIEEFKGLAVKEALRFMKSDAKHAEVREFKDMVNIVNQIDASYKDQKDTGPTVNVMIQNLVQKFQGIDDDC